jgi:TetR/AcrR family transcriptional regulator, repressor for uid operon
MNVHSQAMNQHASLSSDHRARILAAAKRCFVRSGFHRATMNDVATEAGMSAGNIYRYFRSKDEIVSAICEADRADIARSFAELDGAGDPMAAFIAIGERHLVQESREQAVFALDLWAEASRHPKIAQICGDFDKDIRRWVAGLLQQLTTGGQAVPDLDVDGVVELLLSFGDGLLARKARDPSFDPAPHVQHVASIVALAAAGMIPSLRTGASSSGPSAA